jgi:hypothetical protein
LHHLFKKGKRGGAKLRKFVHEKSPDVSGLLINDHKFYDLSIVY